MSSGISVLRIQNATLSTGALKSNSMPRSGATRLRHIRPYSRVRSVAATSTISLVRPLAVTSVSGCRGFSSRWPTQCAGSMRGMSWAAAGRANASAAASGAAPVRRMERGPLVQVGSFDLGDNKALGSLGETHQDVIARLQVIHTRSAQGFDMHED